MLGGCTTGGAWVHVGSSAAMAYYGCRDRRGFAVKMRPLVTSQAKRRLIATGLAPVAMSVLGGGTLPVLAVVVPAIEPFTRIGVPVLLLDVPDETRTVCEPTFVPLRKVTV